MNIVPPDGPKKTRLAILGESAGKDEWQDKLGFVGATGRFLWSMCRQENLPFRRIGKSKRAEGPCTNGRIHAWVGNVMPVIPREPLKGKAIDRALDEWVPWLEKQLPEAEVYLLIGNLACRALLSGALPVQYRSNLYHCTTVTKSEEANGLIRLPGKSHLVIMRHPAALLRGEDQWYPSCMLALHRVACLLGLVPERMPQPPPLRSNIYPGAAEMQLVLDRAAAQGRISIDLETTRDGRHIYIAGFAAENEAWIFEQGQALELMHALFAMPQVTIVTQNGTTYDLPILDRHGVKQPAGVHRDTRWIHSLLAPRMPHDLATMSAHCLPWGPPNWKWKSEDVHPLSETARKYCIEDVNNTHHLERILTQAARAQGISAAVARQDRLLPVITRCAIDGARIDKYERARLRKEFKEAHESLFKTFYDSVSEWAAGELAIVEPRLAEAERVWQKWSDASFKKKGADIRVEEGLTTERAKERRDAAKESVDQLRRDIARYASVGPTKHDLIREYLFSSERGLKIKGAKRTDTGKLSVGRRALAALLARADIVKRIEAGDERLGVLRVISDAERLRSLAAIHLGAKSEDGKILLDEDTQLRPDSTIAVIYNPVQQRMSAGRAKADPEKVEEGAVQVHNMSSSVVVTIDGAPRKWNLRTQVIADLPGQHLWGLDWRRMEQYTMAWAAGKRIGYWDWLESLYDGVDTHCEVAAIMWPEFELTPMCALGDCAHRKNSIPAGGVQKKLRDAGKQVNHAICLGGREGMLKEQYGFPVKLAKQLVSRFLGSERGQKILELQEHIEQEAINTQRVTTPFKEYVDFYPLFGGRLRNPRKAYATPQQGTAAIIMQECMPDVDKIARQAGGRAILSVHDELLSCVKDTREHVVDAMRAVMEQRWECMPVPFDKGRGLTIPVDVKGGKNWGECK